MTYIENYQAFLNDQIEKGGNDILMEETVSEFNAVENPADYRPSELYRTWVRGVPHLCSRCKKSFKFKSIELVPAPSAEVLCHACNNTRTEAEFQKLEAADAEGSTD